MSDENCIQVNSINVTLKCCSKIMEINTKDYHIYKGYDPSIEEYCIYIRIKCPICNQYAESELY